MGKVLNTVKEYLVSNQEKDFLILCDNDKKKELLSYLNECEVVLNVSFLTLDSFLSKVSFNYDYHAIYFLMKNKNLNYDTAKMYLSNLINLFLVEDACAEKEKLKTLQELYDLLNKNHLLIKNDLFKKSLKNKTILLDNAYLSRTDSKILDLYTKEMTIIKMPFEEEEEEVDKLFNTLYYENFNHELNQTCEKIAFLINQGKDINKIKIVIGSESYINPLAKKLSFYHLPYNLYPYQSIKNMEVVTSLLESALSNDKEKIEALTKTTNLEKLSIIHKTIDCINKYASLDQDSYKKEIILKDLGRLKKIEKQYEKAIDIMDVSMLEALDDSQNTIFILGFNDQVFPSKQMDDGFLRAKTFEKNGISTPSEYNLISKKKMIHLLKCFEDIHFSFSKRGYLDEFTISSLATFKQDEKKNPIFEKDLCYSIYSDELNKTLYNARNDLFNKFGEKDDSLLPLHVTYEATVKPYENQFTGLDQQNFLEKNKKSLSDYDLTISFSALDNYYKCPFKYYVNNVLGFNKMDKNFNTIVGSVYHKVLESAFDDNMNRVGIDLLAVYDQELKDQLDENKYELTLFERYLNQKLRLEAINVVDAVESQYEDFLYKNASYELEQRKEFKRAINGKEYSILFKGYIDKIMYSDNVDEQGQKTRSYAIVDYKTGTSTKFEKKLVKYGLSLQLLTYIYLENNDLRNQHIKPEVGGVFLQHILTKFPKDDSDRLSTLKLDGAINLDKSIHPFIKESNVTAYVTKTSNSTKEENRAIIDNEQASEYEKIVSERTEKVIDEILNAHFPIEPIKVDIEKVDGCKYCGFSDICYKKMENYKKY